MFTIGQLAKKTGTRTSALRYYEEAGVLPNPARLSGRRLYGDEAVRRVNVLKFAQAAGFSLDEIKVLFSGFERNTPLAARWKTLAQKKLRDLALQQESIDRMRHALQVSLECGCARIEDCLLSPSAANQKITSRECNSCG